MKRGELWWAELEKRRPVVLLSRDEAYEIRGLVTVAPVTTRIRSLSVEIRLGRDEGLPKTCVANLDTITTIPKRALVERIATLSGKKLEALDDALRFALGLDG
jgi:mRNA interferase MazF